MPKFATFIVYELHTVLPHHIVQSNGRAIQLINLSVLRICLLSITLFLYTAGFLTLTYLYIYLSVQAHAHYANIWISSFFLFLVLIRIIAWRNYRNLCRFNFLLILLSCCLFSIILVSNNSKNDMFDKMMCPDLHSLRTSSMYFTWYVYVILIWILFVIHDTY